jgi:transketolase N-terminal domain/subunit
MVEARVTVRVRARESGNVREAMGKIAAEMREREVCAMRIWGLGTVWVPVTLGILGCGMGLDGDGCLGRKIEARKGRVVHALFVDGSLNEVIVWSWTRG